jgi:hypothetical protein
MHPHLGNAAADRLATAEIALLSRQDESRYPGLGALISKAIEPIGEHVGLQERVHGRLYPDGYKSQSMLESGLTAPGCQ